MYESLCNISPSILIDTLLIAINSPKLDILCVYNRFTICYNVKNRYTICLIFWRKFGHRTINETEELKSELIEIIEKLIVEENVDTFLFGSKSRFNSLCQETVTKIKERYPYIKRIYVRA